MTASILLLDRYVMNIQKTEFEIGQISHNELERFFELVFYAAHKELGARPRHWTHQFLKCLGCGLPIFDPSSKTERFFCCSCLELSNKRPGYFNDIGPCSGDLDGLMPRQRLTHATSMIYTDRQGCSKRIESGLTYLGKSTVIVSHPLEAIQLAQSTAESIDAIFMSLQDGADIVDWFSFVKDEHPDIRRIAFAEHDKDFDLDSVNDCQPNMILWDP